MGQGIRCFRCSPLAATARVPLHSHTVHSPSRASNSDLFTTSLFGPCCCQLLCYLVAWCHFCKFYRFPAWALSLVRTFRSHYADFIWHVGWIIFSQYSTADVVQLHAKWYLVPMELRYEASVVCSLRTEDPSVLYRQFSARMAIAQ